MNDLLNKIITLVSMETKTTPTGKVMVKVKDQDNKSYQIWKTKADGTDSVAYTRLEEIGGAMAVGKTIEISYKEEQGEFQGKPVSYRTIVNIKLTTQVAKAQTMVNLQRAEASKKSDDDKWTEISKGKVRHGVACEFIRLGAEFSPVTTAKIDKWVSYIMTGEIFSKEVKEEEVPTINIEDLGEEIKVSDIPF